jgi:hypothetical protein
MNANRCPGRWAAMPGLVTDAAIMARTALCRAQIPLNSTSAA